MFMTALMLLQLSQITYIGTVLGYDQPSITSLEVLILLRPYVTAKNVNSPAHMI